LVLSRYGLGTIESGQGPGDVDRVAALRRKSGKA
jgi:hypothetical protein